MTTSVKSDWIKLEKFSFAYWSKPLPLEDDEFIMIPQKYAECDSDGIYKYKNKEWLRIIDYDSEFNCECHAAAIDKSRKMIYAYDKEAQLHEFDLVEKRLKRTNKLLERNCGPHPRIVYVNDEIHIIGGRRCNKHYIFHLNTRKTEEIYEFSEIATKAIADHEMVYVEAINSILMVGGESDGSNYLNTIYQFSLSERFWKRLSVKLPTNLAGFGLTLTKCGQFVLIIGGYGGGTKGNIFILDIKSMIIRKSKIQTPKGVGCCTAIAVNNNHKDRMLTFGYIRTNFNDNLSLDLMELISEFICDEWCHMIKWSEAEHWKIRVSDILNS